MKRSLSLVLSLYSHSLTALHPSNPCLVTSSANKSKLWKITGNKSNMGENRKTVVFFSVEGYGHVHPFVQLGNEMRSRGYRVVMLTTFPLMWSEQVKKTGLELDHCVVKSVEEENWISDAPVRLTRTVPVDFYTTGWKKDGVLWRIFELYIRKSSAIEAKVRSYKPDLLVFDLYFGLPWLPEIAPKWVRSFSGFPSELFRCFSDRCVAGMGLKPEEMTPEMKKLELGITKDFREKLRHFYTSQGYEDLPYALDYSPTSPYLNFYFGTEEMGLEHVPQFNPLPDCWFRLEHIIPKSTSARVFEIPECLANLPGKLIYFSLGSACICNQLGIDHQNRLLDILSRSPHRFIVSKGPMHEHVKLHANMWGDNFVDQKAILPIVDLFITHGGHNSSMEAFYYGVPGQIVIPLCADQFDVAQRIEDCGFGKRLNFTDCTEDELNGAIESLLANQELRERMKKIGSRLRSIDYVKIGADKLDGLINDVEK